MKKSVFAKLIMLSGLFLLLVAGTCKKTQTTTLLATWKGNTLSIGMTALGEYATSKIDISDVTYRFSDSRYYFITQGVSSTGKDTTITYDSVYTRNGDTLVLLGTLVDFGALKFDYFLITKLSPSELELSVLNKINISDVAYTVNDADVSSFLSTFGISLSMLNGVPIQAKVSFKR